MLFFVAITRYSLKYIYVRVYLLMLDLPALQSFVPPWVLCVLFVVDRWVQSDHILLIHLCPKMLPFGTKGQRSCPEDA
jgi:hypothetical protein